MLRRVALTAFLAAAVALAGAQKLQYEKYSLPNGMTVILHEDHSLPVAAVDVWYKVGSKDEPARRSGFAHLFEHLMFMGTKRVPNGRFDSIMEAAGGSNNAPPPRTARSTTRAAPAISSPPSSGWRPTAWKPWAATSTRRSWTSSATW